ncbi:tetratricopeptide repeat-containing sensor histidine kinase [Cecembia rubra]|uniref:histidine kinase n=1 Tax=Cecembia rubra TaxID=1485585 RepID=A0A2P8ECW2_9BACT|nr:tetratricopeptide repeat-containing sensor histidine kinase [Cecembia rubra]PSL07267.1 tetratricopeptide repeat protein [Cecembia rubra]
MPGKAFLLFIFCINISAQLIVKGQTDSLFNVLDVLQNQRPKNLEKIAQLQFEIAMTYYQERDFQRSLLYHKVASENFLLVNKLEKYGECLHNLGNIAYYLGNSEEAIQYYRASIVEREKLMDHKGLASGYNNLANVYNRLGEYQQALEFYEKSLEIKEKIGDQKGTASTLKNIASIHYFRDNYVAALETNLKALRISESLHDSLGISFVYNNIALIYEKQDKWDEALSYYMQSLAIKEKTEDSQGMATTLNNIGSLYQRKKEFDKAIEALEKSLNISEKIGEKEGISAAINNLASIYEDLGQTEKAMKLFLQSQRIDEEIGNKRGMLLSITSLSQIQYVLKNYKESIKLAKEGIDLAKQLDSKAELRDLNGLLSKNFEALGDYRAALHHNQLFQEYADSVFNQEIERKTARIEAEYEYDKKLAIIQAEQKALELENEKELQRQNFQKRLLLLALFGIILIAGILYQNYRKQKKAKQLLEIKTQELEKANQVKAKLFSIIGHDLRGPLASLFMLLGLYRQNRLDDNEFKGLVPELYKNVGAIMETLNNLLRWSISQMNMVKSVPVPTSLSEKVIEIESFNSTLLRQKNLNFRNQIPIGTLVLVDPNHLDLILRNLLSNAIKYSKINGTITLKSLEKDGMIIISVKDEGIGMNQQEADQLFQSDLVKSKRGTSGEQGTGLGLNLTQLYIEENGGKIWVESEQNKGSVFYFSLPAFIED